MACGWRWPGIVFGTLASLALARVLDGLLYGIEPTDPVTYVVIAATLARSWHCLRRPFLRAAPRKPIQRARFALEETGGRRQEAGGSRQGWQTPCGGLRCINKILRALAEGERPSFRPCLLPPASCLLLLFQPFQPFQRRRGIRVAFGQLHAIERQRPVIRRLRRRESRLTVVRQREEMQSI